jgi:hypothetical protein|tara:strand:+ start:5074 stop:5334 length:261 start_codon:yes stop_codon:yes gene_type:complete
MADFDFIKLVQNSLIDIGFNEEETLYTLRDCYDDLKESDEKHYDDVFHDYFPQKIYLDFELDTHGKLVGRLLTWEDVLKYGAMLDE